MSAGLRPRPGRHRGLLAPPAARAAASVAASPPRSPADALAKLRKVLFHASAYGAWPAIADLGLRTPAQVFSDAADPRRRAVRNNNVELVDPSGHHIVIRDQRPMVRAGIDAHLDGITMAEWLDVLNERSFFFARQKELTTMVARYQATEGQDVVVFDAAKLLAAAAGRVEVATVIPCEPVSWTRCPCRNRATFVPINDY